MRSCFSASFYLVIVASVHLFPVFLRVEGAQLSLLEYLENNMRSVKLTRVKRIVDRPPRPKTTEAPLTSEEKRERASGTESPHIYDYPDAIYKNEEMRKGEWNGNPLAKKRSKEYTKVEESKPKSETKKVSTSSTRSSSSSQKSPIPAASTFGGVFSKLLR